MNPKAVLARFNPSTPRLGGVGGGTPELLLCEMSGALPKDKFQQAVLLTKWAGWPRQELVALLLLRRVVDMAIAKGWARSGVKYKTLAEAAVDEWLNPPRCRECDGMGETKPHVRCERCHGRGTVRQSGRKKARAVGVDESTWRRVWARRYDDVVAILEEAESDGLRYMKWKLG